MNNATLETVLDYHERTKHQPGKLARSLGYLDWDTQPDPFRRYVGAELSQLTETPLAVGPAYNALFETGSIPVERVDHISVSQLFYDSLALSAWKAVGGNRWSLRCNPSSGNLHPTEGYLIAGPISDLCDQPTLFHYQPFLHALEKRAALPGDLWDAISSGLPENAILVGLSSIYWRESWKYGERAFRYCQHDVGHAIAAIAFAAGAQGWETRMLPGMTDRWLGQLLSIDQQQGSEAEHPDCLLALYPQGQASPADLLHDFTMPDLPDFDLRGQPNHLSDDHYPWPVIDQVSAAATQVASPALDFYWDPPSSPSPSPSVDRPLGARQIIRQRRSAMSMDGETSLGREVFYQMMLRTLPGPNPPLATLPWRPAIHLALFVHRVDDLPAGLYLLVRDPNQLASLQSALRDDFLWQKPPACPDDLPLWLLAKQNVQSVARSISCNQDIASDGAIAIAMLAEFEPLLQKYGPWFYKRLHWEAGAIGQILYLEAEAADLRGCGIGCFFDDAMHHILGLQDRHYQTLYHFTVGGPIEDERLQTLPAYWHLQK